jgi:hypothetical protein
LALIAACLSAGSLWAAESKWVYTGATGRLIYAPDAEGDRVLDFSMVGYGAGKREIPSNIPVAIHIDPIAGDNRQHIQNAINTVGNLPIQANGYRGVVELGPGKWDVIGQLTINKSGIILRGAGGGDSLAANTHIVAQNDPLNTFTGTPDSTPVINITGSSSGTARGPQINIVDKVVPVGAQSFRVASTAGLSVGGMVEIYRPGSQAWVEELGMHLIPSGAWTGNDRQLRWHRTVTRIEGNRVFIDAPITTAIDQQWSTGTVRTYNSPNRITNVGIENLRGQSLDTRDEANEARIPSFVRFTRVKDGFVRDVQTRHFSYASVFTSEADGGQYITVDNVHSRLPSGQVTGGRRYTFAMDGQYSLVKNSTADSGRHDFVTGSDVVGPIVFTDSSVTTARADSGPHHRWGTGLLFDNTSVSGNAINVQNRWDSGTGHGWAGANVVIWNSTANSFIAQSPPTAQTWLVGSTGTINAGNCHLGGATCAGYYDSHGTKVTTGGSLSLYDAQVNDAADIREFHWSGGTANWNDALQWDEKVTPAVYRVSMRDYLVGDIDSFTNDGASSVDAAYIDPAWQAAIQSTSALPITGFDDLVANKNMAFTIQHQLDLGERLVHGFLAVALRQAADDVSTDFIRLFDLDPVHQRSFSSLGWTSQINTSHTFVGVLDLGGDLEKLQSGAVNVQINDDTGADWAMYVATVATPIADSAGPNVFIDGGGIATLDSSGVLLRSLQIGGSQPSQLRLKGSATIDINNDFDVLANGTLTIELNSSTTSLPLIEATGSADLAGRLSVQLAPGFTPALNRTFRLMSSLAGVNGDFDYVGLPSLPYGLGWDFDYNPTTVDLFVVASWMTGDYDHNGVVDAGDYVVYRDTFGQTGVGLAADGNGNNQIDPGDFSVWRANFGNVASTSGSATTTSAVPEPAAVLLLIIGIFACACRRTF